VTAVGVLEKGPDQVRGDSENDVRGEDIMQVLVEGGRKDGPSMCTEPGLLG
jgi:hypothetical protein